MKIALSITSKLILLFSIFIFIFYGTLLVLFVNIQTLMETSEDIVSVNHQISTLSQTAIDSLINMEINDRKFRLLKKEAYRIYFETAEKDFYDSLDHIIKLDSSKHPISQEWKSIQKSFKTQSSKQEAGDIDKPVAAWADEDLLNGWMDKILTAKRANQQQIDHALIKINTLGKQNVKNSFLGLGISILAGILGAVFISKSIISPLKKLKTGLKHVSNDNYGHVIKIDSKDEFSELATAFNEMNLQLKKDENIRSDFIATLSHEIRTPLSSIQESVKLIIEQVLGPVNAKQKKFLAIALSETNRINNLFNHLLKVSILESGSGKLDPEPIDPNKLIREASRILTSKEKINTVKIRLNECKSAPNVLGVKKEIMQVLLNIIGNAVKFSYKDSFVDVFVLNDKESRSIKFQICDHGPGIPQEEQGLIFKKYYRAKSVRDHMDGVGLGLNISKKIITANGGKIQMKNNKTKGCSFFFTLPKTVKKLNSRIQIDAGQKLS